MHGHLNVKYKSINFCSGDELLFFNVKRELISFFKTISVISRPINTGLFPTNFTVGCDAATYFSNKLRPHAGSYKCRRRATCCADRQIQIVI